MRSYSWLHKLVNQAYELLNDPAVDLSIRGGRILSGLEGYVEGNVFLVQEDIRAVHEVFWDAKHEVIFEIFVLHTIWSYE